ncbi:uncharacterized protein LOC132192446 [Neocloeon triangulifer]|uniref:uncharacterized protein LOC132192446 n=1 Tax=Neocloeon triangulifer TaxID=2078957 RepID=UPI00286F51C7|nr:uncharacterized protein LOC132192446 [Neocloeon triangulifer]XP_059468395.1 uncharacterized protein LOC132192446 [Neocloeon triangulifer]
MSSEENPEESSADSAVDDDKDESLFVRLCDRDESKNIFSAAKIPWIASGSTTNPNTLRTEDVATISKYLLSPEEEIQGYNLFMYKVWTHAMPYFLPPIFHSKAFKLTEEKIENPLESMRSALYFFWASCAHSSEFSKTATQEENCEELLESNILDYFLELKRNVMPRFDECSAVHVSDFLFDKLIILQMMYNPVLLHQWLMVAYGQYLVIQAKLNSRPVAGRYPEIESLAKYLSERAGSLLGQIKLMFDYLHELTTCHPEQDQSKRILLLGAKKFVSCVQDILKILDSFDCGYTHQLDNLIKASFIFDPSSLKSVRLEEVPCSVPTLNKNVLFWKRNSENPDLGIKDDVSKYKTKLSNREQDELTKVIMEEGSKSDLVWLTEDDSSNQYFIKDLLKQENSIFSKLYEDIMERKDAYDVCKSDFGPYHSIHIAEGEVHRQYCLALFKTFILGRAKLTVELEPSLSLPTLSRSHKEALINEILSYLNSLALYHERWNIGLKDHFDFLQPIIKPIKVFRYNLNSLSTANLIQGFNYMIEETVVQLLKKQLLEKWKPEYSYETTLVNYVLPWFVAAYQFLATDNESRASEKLLQKYRFFLYILLSNYDVSKCVTSPKWCGHHIPSILALFPTLHVTEITELIRWKLCCVESEYNRLFEEDKAPLLDSYFTEQLDIFTRYYYVLDFEYADKIWEQNFAISSRHSYRFLSKLALSLKVSADNFASDTAMQTTYEVLWYFVTAITNLLPWKRNEKDFSFEIEAYIDILDSKLSRKQSKYESIFDCKNLSLNQIAGVVIYQILENISDEKQTKFKEEFKSLEPLDDLERSVFGILRRDPWETKQVFCQKWFNDSKRQDLSLVSFEFAKTNASKFYAPILKNVSSHFHVRMRKRGEISFFPVKHCRWCGKVDVEEFRICQECLCEEEYPDVNLFCSDICENNAMKKVHKQEHERFLISKCDI